MERQRILVVEDEETVAVYLGDILRRLGFDICASVRSGTEAVALPVNSTGSRPPKRSAGSVPCRWSS